MASFLRTCPFRIVKLDLANFDSIRSAVKEVASFAKQIDILINNAGVMNIPERQLSKDSFEMHLAVNYLGPFLLTKSLIDQSLVARDCRIVNVGSNGYYFSPFRFTDYNFDGGSLPEDEWPPKDLCEQYGLPWLLGYTPTIAYGQSKTASLLFTVQLARLYQKDGISAICVHPGGTVTVHRK